MSKGVIFFMSLGKYNFTAIQVLLSLTLKSHGWASVFLDVDYIEGQETNIKEIDQFINSYRYCRKSLEQQDTYIESVGMLSDDESVDILNRTQFKISYKKSKFEWKGDLIDNNFLTCNGYDFHEAFNQRIGRLQHRMNLIKDKKYELFLSGCKKQTEATLFLVIKFTKI